MHFYYMDFVIKEQQNQELEESERRRRLRRAREQDSESATGIKASSLNIGVVLRMISQGEQDSSEVTVPEISTPETEGK